MINSKPHDGMSLSLSDARMACSQQPVHLQQQQQQQAAAAGPAINVPNMANYATALSSRLVAANGQVVKEGQGVVQLQMATGQMSSVITESKVAGGGVVVVPEVQVGVAGAAGGGGGDGAVAVAVQAGEDVPRTKGGREKRYPCPYCTWSGVDNWCLKRHLNTHLKPYVCALCDYKAARTERLHTHVLKVHNKRSCVRCNYMADDQNQLNAHLQEHQ